MTQRKIRTIYEIGRMTGLFLSREETEELLVKGVTPSGRSLASCMELKGIEEALEYAEKTAGEGAGFTEEELLRLHFLLYYRTAYEQAGRYRAKPAKEGIGPCPLPEELEHLMKHFMNQMETSKGIFSPLEYGTIGHKRILDLCPFSLGNKRTALLVLNALLLREGYAPVFIPKELEEEYEAGIEKARQGEFPDVRPLTGTIEKAVRFCERES